MSEIAPADEAQWHSDAWQAYAGFPRPRSPQASPFATASTAALPSDAASSPSSLPTTSTGALMPHVHHHRLPVYTLAGAISGGAATGLGAVVLHPADPDHFQRGPAALCGLVGGAVTHAAIGILAACGPGSTFRREAAHIGSSSVLSCLTSGLVGGALLSAAGNHDHPGPGHLVAAGAVGGVLVSAAILGTGIGLWCCGVGLWLGQQARGVGERLLDGAEDVERAAEEA